MDVQLVGKDGSVLLPGEGNDTNAATISPAADAPVDLPPARARPGESRKQTWERLRQEARAAGMTKPDAYQYATREVDRVRQQAEPPPEPEPVAVEPATAPDPPAALELPPSSSTGGGLAGLGELPAAWPVLPANASLQAEVAWVQANRIRVKPNGSAVDLSLSLSPAPSYAALSWLETSILYPAKFADVAVKASQDQQDDQQDVRREKVALSEVQGLLGEAVSASA